MRILCMAKNHYIFGDQLLHLAVKSNMNSEKSLKLKPIPTACMRWEALMLHHHMLILK
jgi:hypothetical protein